MIAPKLSWHPIEIVLAALVAVCFTVMSIVAVRHRPSVGFDASMGLLTWQSMERGSTFNHLRMASKEDLSVDRNWYWASHTPGQYLLPAAISGALRAPIGTGITILQIVGIASGILGYYLLYIQTFAFARKIALFACLVILLRVQTLCEFVEYSGGALLLFAATPWFLMSSWACLKRRGVYLTLVPFIFLAGAFLKLSFAIVALSLTAASILRGFLRRGQLTRSQLALRWAVDLLTFLFFYSMLVVLHTSRGWTASLPSIGRTTVERGVVFCYSLASILSNALSIFTSARKFGAPFDSLWQQAYLVLPLLHTVPAVWLIVLVAAAAAFLIIFCAVWSRVTDEDYRLLLLALAAVHTLVLTSLFLGGRLIPEDRHFWPASALLLPGLLTIVLKIRSTQWRSLLIVLLFIQLTYAVQSERVFFKEQALAAESPSLGISFPTGSQQLVNTIQRLDSEPAEGRRVFFFTEADLALLVQRNTNIVYSDPLEKNFPHTDRLDRLFVILPDAVFREKSRDGIQSLYPDRKSWQVASIGAHTILCAGCNGPEEIYSSSGRPLLADAVHGNRRVLDLSDYLHSTPFYVKGSIGSAKRWLKRQIQ